MMKAIEKMKRGLLITFEGGEGAGKSIQVEILASHLREKGYPIVVTREPGGTRIGEQIRAITHNPENVDMEATTEAYLMAAARAQHVAQIIEPALEAGKIIVCDRYVDSNVVYQGFGRRLGAETIARLNDMAINGAIPDITFLLNVPPKLGLLRRTKSLKARDRLDIQQREFYHRVYQGYLDLAKDNGSRYVVIDASKTIVDVATEVWQFVKNRLEKRHEKR